MNLIARELEYLQEGLIALQRSVQNGQTEETEFIVGHLLTGTARLIERCKIQRKPNLAIPDDERTTGRMR
jgi:hypothetical protein